VITPSRRNPAQHDARWSGRLCEPLRLLQTHPRRCATVPASRLVAGRARGRRDEALVSALADCALTSMFGWGK
jgi:hypothetical protein